MQDSKDMLASEVRIVLCAMDPHSKACAIALSVSDAPLNRVY